MHIKQILIPFLYLTNLFWIFPNQFTFIQNDSTFIEIKDTIKIEDDINESKNNTNKNYPKTKVLNTLPPGVKKADSLFLFSDNIMLVDVKKISYKEISYTEPGEMDLYKIDRRKVYKIIYKSGLVEILNSIEKHIPDSKDWKTILVTENKEEVADYIMIEKIKGESQNIKEEVNNDVLERSALIILKKKASLLDADIILITDRVIFRGYGEPPRLTLKGIAYKIN